MECMGHIPLKSLQASDISEVVWSSEAHLVFQSLLEEVLCTTFAELGLIHLDDFLAKSTLFAFGGVASRV